MFVHISIEPALNMKSGARTSLFVIGSCGSEFPGEILLTQMPKKKKKKNVQRARFKTFFLDYTASFINKMPFPDWSMTAYSAIQLRLKLCYVSSEIARLILFGSN